MMTTSEIIGSVSWQPPGRRRRTATLDGAGRWTLADGDTALGRMFAKLWPLAEAGPSEGISGRSVVLTAAAALGGVASFPDPGPGPSGPVEY